MSEESKAVFDNSKMRVFLETTREGKIDLFRVYERHLDFFGNPYWEQKGCIFPDEIWFGLIKNLLSREGTEDAPRRTS